MTDKATQLAQAAADRVSRRSFLGRFGRTAAVAAAALGGMLMIPDDAQAGKPCGNGGRGCPRGQYCAYGRCVRY